MKDLNASICWPSSGARLVVEPFDVPNGPTLAAVDDPEGNPLVLVEQRGRSTRVTPACHTG